MKQVLNLKFIFVFFVFFFTNQANALRIVSLAPSLTEIVFALGAGRELVGVTNQCDYPYEATKIRKIGDYNNPNYEIILSLKPELILALGYNVPEFFRYNRKIITLNPQSVPEVTQTIEQLGQILHKEHEALKISKEITNEWENLKNKRVFELKYLLLLDTNPIYTASSHSWLGSLFSQAGFVNIVGNSNLAFPQISQEYLLTHKPDVVFVAITGDKLLIESKIHTLFKFDNKNPVAIIFLPNDIFMRPGPRILEAMKFLEAQVLPKFSNYKKK